MKSKARIRIVCGVLVCFCALANAQDYYSGGNGSWRRQPTNKHTKDTSYNNSEPSGYISINLGFATPEGSFGTTFGPGYAGYTDATGLTVASGNQGYALPGSIFDFSMGIPIEHSNFGVALMFGSSSNTYDINTFTRNLNASNSGFEYEAAPGNNFYSLSSIMGGLFVTYPIGRLSIDGRLMLGALLSGLPEQSFVAGDAAGDSYEYDLPPTNTSSLAFDAGIGARFFITELGRRKLCALVKVDFLYSNVSYNNNVGTLYYTPVTNNPNNITYYSYTYPSGSLPAELLNVTFGLGYQL